MFDFPNAPNAGDIYTGYTYDGSTWNITGSVQAAGIGDVKSGFATTDHNGWIKLDGRLITTLTATQQANAIALGFATNLPDGNLCGLRQDGAATPGVVGGSSKITVVNLPAHNMTSSGHDAAAVTSSSAGNHHHSIRSKDGAADNFFGYQNQGDVHAFAGYAVINTPSGSNLATIYQDNYAGAHTHTIDMPNHTHTVALGGSATDYYAKAIVVNFFVYLGT